jgi:catechol 2,3-dioxygenase-like lactoylglutathione lyase family enzyme
MNGRVQIVLVPVSDQERAKDFYVNSLGFELRADDSWGQGMRWVEVAPKGSDASLPLVTWFDAMPPGSLHS